MAHDIEIRFRCRALFEVMNMKLVDISKQENIAMGTLSEWKNDDRKEYGGIWLQGCKAANVKKAATKLKEELEATSIFDEIKGKVKDYSLIKDDKLEIKTLEISNQDLAADIEAEVTLLSAINADWFDSKMFRNALYSSALIERKMKKNPDSVKQSDLKMSSDTIRMAKESRFGKSPETVIFNANGEYSKEELDELSLEDIEKLLQKEQSNVIELKAKSEHPNEHPIRTTIK